MPTYDYQCSACGHICDRIRRIENRDKWAACDMCDGIMARVILSAPLGRVAGRPVQGGGADRFTADMLGIPLKELPAGLRQDKGQKSE